MVKRGKSPPFFCYKNISISLRLLGGKYKKGTQLIVMKKRLDSKVALNGEGLFDYFCNNNKKLKNIWE